MKILISNDDGYQAKGIKQLTKSLSQIADVIVVAPSENKSAASSSLTLGKPLKPIQIEKNIIAGFEVDPRINAEPIRKNPKTSLKGEHVKPVYSLEANT